MASYSASKSTEKSAGETGIATPAELIGPGWGLADSEIKTVAATWIGGVSEAATVSAEEEGDSSAAELNWNGLGSGVMPASTETATRQRAAKPT